MWFVLIFFLVNFQLLFIEPIDLIITLCEFFEQLRVGVYNEGIESTLKSAKIKFHFLE